MSFFTNQSVKYKELRSRMHALGIYEKDLKEVFIHSSGPGGQNVNKVATCVFLEHVPTGITIKCQEERVQIQNRFKAREYLIKKIKLRLEKKELERIAVKEKERRRKRTRSRAGKEIMLKQKRHRSETKALRRKLDLRKGQDE